MRILKARSARVVTALLLAVALSAGGAALAAKGGGKGGGDSGGGGGGGGGKGGGKGGGGGGGGGETTVVQLAGAGDSIMRGYNASCTRNTGLFDFLCYGGGDQPQNSFFNGSSSQVLSLLDRYLTVSQATASQGAAASGSELTDPALNNFAAQASAILAAASTPTVVFVELGGNDICNRPNVDALYDDPTWTAAVDAGLGLLVNGLPDGSSVVLTGVPRVQDLRGAGILLETSTSSINCQAFWSTWDVCPIATASDEALGAIGERQQRYNEILFERAQVFNSNALTTGVEVVTDHVNGVSAVGSYRFTAEDLNGGDCFHPSIRGQNTLAELLWGARPN